MCMLGEVNRWFFTAVCASDKMIIIGLLQSHPSTSMNNQFSFSTQRSGKRQEQSILNEYKRLNMDQQSFYFSVEPIGYVPVPKFIPAALAKGFSHCIYLENLTFYEMFTFAISEHLFRGGPQIKVAKVDKLKELICSNNFLNFASFTKGLILKGLKIMADNAKKNNGVPVAEVLMGSEKLPAFCECWKEMLFYFKNKHQELADLNSSMIEVFTHFFQLDLHFFTKKGKDFQEEVIRSKSQGGEHEKISILLISSAYDEDENVKEQSISSISSIYGNWSYYVLIPKMLTDKQEQYIDLPLTRKAISGNNRFMLGRRATITMDYPELFAIDEEKSQIKSKIRDDGYETLIANARGVMKKGSSLVEQMKKFTDRIITN